MGQRVHIRRRHDRRQEHQGERAIRDDGSQRGGEADAEEGRSGAEEHPRATKDLNHTSCVAPGLNARKVHGLDMADMVDMDMVDMGTARRGRGVDFRAAARVSLHKTFALGEKGV